MTRQADYKIRAVSLANLTAMCDRESGMTHRYSCWIKGSKCILEYSNPDEYGHDRPYSVSLPLLRTKEADNPDVLFHVLSERGPGLDSYDKEACFQVIESLIFSGPVLWREPDGGAWLTRYEVLCKRGRKYDSTTGGPTRAKRDADGTYRVVTHPAGLMVAAGMCEADAEVLQRALFDAQQQNGSPDAWNPTRGESV